MPHAALGAHRQTTANRPATARSCAVRRSPCAIFTDERRLIDGSRDEALITHFDPQAWTGSIAINMLIARLLRDMPLRMQLRMSGRACGVSQAHRPKSPKCSSGARPNLDGRIAIDIQDMSSIHSISHSGRCSAMRAWKTRVVAAVNQGGDADTQGAVAGRSPERCMASKRSRHAGSNDLPAIVLGIWLNSSEQLRSCRRTSASSWSV